MAARESLLGRQEEDLRDLLLQPGEEQPGEMADVAATLEYFAWLDNVESEECA